MMYDMVREREGWRARERGRERDVIISIGL